MILSLRKKEPQESYWYKYMTFLSVLLLSFVLDIIEAMDRGLENNFSHLLKNFIHNFLNVVHMSQCFGFCSLFICFVHSIYEVKGGIVCRPRNVDLELWQMKILNKESL